MSLKGHMEVHGSIHAFWIISILIAIIAGLTLLVPNGTILRDYISFASAISSIILAVIAIFYSMFSNQGFSEMVGSLQTSVKQTEHSSAALESASTSLTLLAAHVSSEVSSLAPRFDAVESKIEKGLSPDRALRSAAPEEGHSVDERFAAGPIPSGLAVALYVVKKMHDTGLTFNAKQAFSTTTWQYYVGACLSTIGALKPLDVEITKGKNPAFTLVSLGRLSPDQLEQAIASAKPKKDLLNNIDSYFARDISS